MDPCGYLVKVTKITGSLLYEVTTESGMTLRRHVDHLRRRFSEESQTTLSTQEDGSHTTMKTST